jgi:hypothetical protein
LPGASERIVGRNFNWIWYVGAAVWFLDAAVAMRRGNLRSGLTCAGISAVFLVAGVLLGKMTHRPPGRGGLR